MKNLTYNLVPVDHDPFSFGEIDKVIPTAETQQEIWISCILGGTDANCAYNESMSLRLEGNLEQVILEQALQEIIECNDALRCVFSPDGKQIHVLKHSQTSLDVEDISTKTASNQANYLIEMAKRDVSEPFDLENGPLFRAFLYKLAEGCHILRLTVHHIICDGWSFSVLLEELSECYTAKLEGKPFSPSAVVSMLQYNQEMDAYASSDTYKDTTRYWLNKFRVIPEPIQLPTDKPRLEMQTYQSQRDDFDLDSGLMQKLKQVGSTQGISFVNTLLMSFEVYLSRLTGQTEVIIGLPTAGQAATGHLKSVGHCVNLLPIRGSVISSTSFLEHLKQRKPQLLDDFEHQLFTYGTLLKLLKIKRRKSGLPLLPVVFNIDTNMDANVDFPGIKHTLISHPRVFENFEIFLNLRCSDDKFVLEWSYNKYLFSSATIRQLMDGFNDLIKQIVVSPEMAIDAIVVDKINPKAISIPEVEPSTTRPQNVEKSLMRSSVEKPGKALEEVVVGIWEEILQVDDIQANDDFFELGGHSLLLPKLMAKMEQATNKKLPLTTVFKYPIFHQFVEQYMDGDPLENVAIVAEKISEEATGSIVNIQWVPATKSQKEIWITSVLGGDEANKSYTLSVSLQLNGPFNKGAMENAIQVLTDRHQSLRAKCDESGNQIGILDRMEIAVIEEDLSTMAAEEQVGFIEQANRASYDIPFDLTDGPLFRVTLFKLANEEHILRFSVHHIICDGWSLTIMAEELGKLYSAFAQKVTPQLPPAASFIDYTQKQQVFYDSDAYKRIEAYWISQYSDKVPLMELPTDFPRPAEQTFKCNTLKTGLDCQTFEAFRQATAKIRASQAISTRVILEIVLSRYMKQPDVITGMPVADHLRLGGEPLVANTVSTLPIRAFIDDSLTFIDHLAKRKAALIEAYEHQGITYSSLLRQLDIRRDSTRSSFVPVIFDFFADLTVNDRINFIGMENTYLFDGGPNSSFEFFISISGTKASPVLEWVYNASLFKEETIRLLTQEFKNIMEDVVANPHVVLRDLATSFTSPDNQHFTFVEGPNKSHPKDISVCELFVEKARQFPNNTAIRFQDESLTYADLDKRSNQFAHYLAENGVAPGNIVGLALDRTPELVSCLLGIMKAGATYLPLDPHYPAERISFMLQDSEARVLITSVQYAGRFVSSTKELLITDFVSRSHEFQFSQPSVSTSGNDLAYILYTSGSTGKPKGVQITQKSLVNFLLSMQDEPGMKNDDILLALTTVSFDIAGLELYLPLITGASIVLADDDTRLDSYQILETVKATGVTVVQATPATWRMMLSSGWNQKLPIKALCGGEAFPTDLAEKLMDLCDEVWNLYGPTETTIWSTVKQLKPDESTITVGRPIHNTQVYILDEQLAIVPAGEEGEIYIGGDGVARGYLNRPELNLERFLTAPFPTSANTKIYRTGDLGKVLPNGEIQCLGRIDNQVKVRGFRIELGEIEYYLNKQESIKESVVVVQENQTGDQRIVAYLIPSDLTKRGDIPAEGLLAEKGFISEIKKNLLEFLPPYMIPNDWIFLPEFPLTPNKKIDRKALPWSKNKNKQTKSANRESIKLHVTKIWEKVLGTENIQPDDDFFQLGGHSLLIPGLVNEIKKETGLEVPMTGIFQHSTLHDFTSFFILKKEEPTHIVIGKDDAQIQTVNGNTTNANVNGVKTTTVTHQIPIIEPQREIWLSCMIGGDEANLAYNHSWSLKFVGRFDYDVFQQAIANVVNRHEALRSNVSDDGEYLVVRSIDQLKLPLSFHDISPLPSENEKLNRFDTDVKNESITPFKLNQGPLFRIMVHRLNTELHYFTLLIHHIICDATSLETFLKDISLTYNSLISGNGFPSKHPSQMSEYASSCALFSTSEQHKSLQDFWIRQYQNDIPTLALPTDFLRPERRTYSGNFMSFLSGEDQYIKLTEITRSSRMSMASTLISLIEILLHHRTGSPDVVLGVTTAGQFINGHNDMIGHCVNLLPFRSKIEPNRSTLDYFESRKQYIYEAYDHQQLTFSEILAQLNISREKNQIPLVPFIVTIRIDNGEKLHFEHLDTELIFNPRASHTFEISLSINLNIKAKSISWYWAYNTQLYRPDTIDRMMDELNILIDTISANPTVQIKDSLPLPHPFPLLSDHRCDFPLNRTLLDDFISQAQKTPDNIAVVFQGTRTTYKELDEKSTRLARYLLMNGLSAETPVPLCIQPCPEMIIGLLAIWKAGAAYVPIDPDLPVNRIQHIIEECKSPLVISDSAVSTKLATLPNTKCVNLANSDSEIWAAPVIELNTLPHPSSLAYIIYTSGSTGKPKGVCVTHRSLADYFAGLREHLPALESCTSFSYGNTISTDLGNTILYEALTTGGTLHIFTKEQFNDVHYIGRYFQEQQIDCMKIVPSHWKYLSESAGGLLPKKLLIFGGEVLPHELVKDIIRTGTDCTIVNHYGPTETTIGKLLHIVDPARDYSAIIPIGKPFSNTSVFVFNEHLSQCPIGVTGELYVGGEGLAKGYYNNSALTDGVFVPNPIIGHPHRKLYRTGDIVRWLPDGNIEYVSRRDDQVKIRGNRIELGEVQNNILALAIVKHCAVIADVDENNESRLVAYVVVDGKQFDRTNAIDQLSSRLPDYMVPKMWVVINALPLNANGKLDKKALPKPDSDDGQTVRRFVAPRTEVEAAVVKIWQNSLKLEHISVQDNFFELGGHSLIAVRTASLATKEFNVSVPFSSLFKFPRLEDFAVFIQDKITDTATPSIYSGNEEKTEPDPTPIHVPITESQQEIWLACEMGGKNANKGYILSHAMDLHGQVDVNAMTHAVRTLIERHDSLRASFSNDGQMMIIAHTVDIDLEYNDISEMEAKQKLTYLKDFDATNKDLSFNLSSGPLARFVLIKTNIEEYRFYFFTHHIVCDGWSLRIISKELSTIYSAYVNDINLNIEEAPSFGLYAQALHERQAMSAYADAINFWKESLTPLPLPLDLPLDFARPEKRTYESQYQVYHIPNNILEKLKKLGQDAESSLAITLRVAFETFLYRLTNQTDFILGLPLSGQIAENFENLVGHCVFLLPIRAKLDADSSFLSTLKRRKAEIINAYDHSGITFGSLIRELSIHRDESRIPLVPIVLNTHMDGLEEHLNFAGLTTTSRLNQDDDTFNGFEMSLSMINTDSGLKIEWSYNQGLFNKSTIDSFKERFEFLLHSITADPLLPLNKIPVADQQLLQVQLEKWNDTYVAYDKSKTVHQLVSDCAKKFPSKVALSFHERQITYQELEEESNKIARCLIERGVRVGDTIGVSVERSVNMVIVLIAIMKTGAIYLPFETSHPRSRIEYILKETSAKYLIASSVDKGGYSPEISTLLIEDILRESRKLSSNHIEDVAVSGDDLIYILHTSGSTGKPKGVKIRHRNVVNFLMGMLKRPGIKPNDRLLAATPISFDVAVLMYLSLISGAELIIADEDSTKDGRQLYQLMVEQGISWMIATPATWSMIIDSGWEKPLELLAVSAGEALSKDLADRLLHRCSSVWNGYGPTETAVLALMKEITSVDEPVTLGTPISNTSIYIVDKQDQLVSIGQEGEILIGGDGVGAGYHNLEELTKKSFIKNPFTKEDGDIVYRTGDLGKYLPDGEIQYLGRNDHQVKIRGHRIELGEVEQNLLQIKDIKSVVVKPFGDSPDNMALVGYIVPQDTRIITQDNTSHQAGEHTFSYNIPSTTEINKWRAYLLERLPDYMVPHDFLCLTEFPLTESGKIDGKKLPPPIRHVYSSGQLATDTPMSMTEVKLANIWESLLKIKRIGVNDNFFQLGGHSLMAVKMMIQIEQEIGPRLPISTLIEAPTISKLAAVIEKHDLKSTHDSLVPMKANGTKPPLYVVHGIGLNVLFFQKTIAYLDPDQPVFALQAKGLDGTPRPDQTIEEIAATYIQEILQHNPDGPYALSGYSYGGIVAVEIAKQLTAMGKEIAFVGLFDSYTNKSIGQMLDENRWRIFQYKIKKVLFIPLLFLRSPRLYTRDKYLYARGELYKLFKKVFPNKRLFDDPPKHIETLQKQHLNAMKVYKLLPYDGSITLFKSKIKTVYIPFFETNGWRPYIQKDIHVVEIPCNHKYLFREPAVKILAEELQKNLNQTFSRIQAELEESTMC